MLMDYLRDGQEIYRRSFATIRAEADLARIPADLEKLAVRIIHAGGMTTNDGVIAARFTVQRAGQRRYEKTHRVQHEWEGAFAGAVAIPNAANNYPVMVQKLITKLVSDPDFIQALKP